MQIQLTSAWDCYEVYANDFGTTPPSYMPNGVVNSDGVGLRQAWDAAAVNHHLFSWS
ncbi:MAG: hypothetical protein AAF797_03830 [Planctomycetota bacterium]